MKTMEVVVYILDEEVYFILPSGFENRAIVVRESPTDLDVLYKPIDWKPGDKT